MHAVRIKIATVIQVHVGIVAVRHSRVIQETNALADRPVVADKSRIDTGPHWNESVRCLVNIDWRPIAHQRAALVAEDTVVVNAVISVYVVGVEVGSSVLVHVVVIGRVVYAED